MVVVNSKNVPGVRVPAPFSRELKVVLDPQVGNYDKATILLSYIEPKSSTGLHRHGSDEIMYVVEGEGEAVEVRDGVERVELVTEGCVIYAPSNIEHEIKNLGEGKMVLFCVYIPGLKASGYLEMAIEAAKKYFRGQDHGLQLRV